MIPIPQTVVFSVLASLLDSHVFPAPQTCPVSITQIISESYVKLFTNQWSYNRLKVTAFDVWQFLLFQQPSEILSMHPEALKFEPGSLLNSDHLRTPSPLSLSYSGHH